MTTYPTTMDIRSSSVAFLWRRHYGAVHSKYRYTVAAAIIAREGLGGIIGAVFIG